MTITKARYTVKYKMETANVKNVKNNEMRNNTFKKAKFRYIRKLAIFNKNSIQNQQ